MLEVGLVQTIEVKLQKVQTRELSKAQLLEEEEVEEEEQLLLEEFLF